MVLADFFNIMARTPVNMAKDELIELVSELQWRENPSLAAEIAIRRSGKFDANLYLKLNPDVRFSTIDPYEHYINHGIDEKRIFPVIGSVVTPSVSIIIRIKDVEQDLTATLDSLVDQTLYNIHIVVLDETERNSMVTDIIQTYAQRLENIQLITKKYDGYGSGLNLGLMHCKGQYIAFLNAGDRARPEAYESLYNESEKSELDFIRSGFNKYMGASQIPVTLTKDAMLLDRDMSAGEASGGYTIVNNLYAGIYRVSYLESFAIKFNEKASAEECRKEFWLEIFLLADKFKLLSKYFFDSNLAN